MSGKDGNQDLSTRPGMTFRVDIADPKARVQAYIDSFKDKREDFDKTLMSEHLRLISATATPRATVALEMDILPVYCNRMENMHGGAVALVFDMCTTLCTAPLARKDFWWFGGVSRKLDVTYLRPVRLGGTVVVECEVLQIGRRLATIRGVMREKDGERKVLAVCEHNKASVDVGGEAKM